MLMIIMLCLCVYSNIANYADDNSPYATFTDTESIINHLQYEAKSLKWLPNKCMEANPDKSNLLLNSTDDSLLLLLMVMRLITAIL